MSGNEKSLKEDFSPRSKVYKALYWTLGPPGQKMHLVQREAVDNHWVDTEASLRQMFNIQPGPASCLCSSYTTFCAVHLCLIVFNLLQLHFAVIRVCGSSISDNTLVKPILRRFIRSCANARTPGRVTGYVREWSILAWTVITLCAEN